QNLAVEVGDPNAPNSTINPSAADFDKKESEQSDVTTTVALNGNELIRITNGAAALTAGTDYTIADNEVAIKKEYLAAQPLGTTNLTFSFSGGAARTLAVTIKDTTTRNSAVNPPTISFDKKQSVQADVSTTMELRGNQL
ncbi:xyloglucanase, partial [Paenibacillus sepulcri]|nr:xyloglucanase [Paenibacillus sepulcri]